MRLLNTLTVIVLLLVLCAGCKGKKTMLEHSDTVDDFIELFPESRLPFEVTDVMLNKKETDTSINIEWTDFTRFVPDSVLVQQFGKLKPVIYPLGKAILKNAETYLFVKAVTAAKKTGFILAFDKNKKFSASLPLINTGKNAMPYRRGAMDSKYTITQTYEQKEEDGTVNELKNVYILNMEAHEFSKIVTDEGISNQVQDVINPIDTFSRKGNFAGDYIKDKRNYVSVRDGKDPSVLLFFVHFEKNGGECTGELKGEAVVSGAKSAIYRGIGNPCVLELSFNGNRLTLKETEACGSYRDIKCFFEGSYTRKTDAPAIKVKKKKEIPA